MYCQSRFIVRHTIDMDLHIKKGAAMPPLPFVTDSLLLLQVPHHEKNLPVRHGIPEGAHDVEGVLQIT